MIDTIKLAYPMDRTLYRLLDQNAEKLQKIAPDGEVLWEKSVVRGDCMPSHYSGLRITTRTKRDLVEMGFDPKFIDCDNDLAFFEFSLQKYQSPSAYNNHNSSVQNDLLALAEWVKQLSIALGYVFYGTLYTNGVFHAPVFLVNNGFNLNIYSILAILKIKTTLINISAFHPSAGMSK